jgi:hypothetical protein
MNTWGSYESVKELAQSGPGFLWSAHPKNTTVRGESFIIKTTEGLAILGDPERLDRESALFLEAAQAQARVVESGATHWVKLHEFGKTDAGAFYVADLYARSVQKIVARSIRLDPRSLSTLVHAVVDGLLELRSALGRAHGNLKPSNVLIGGPDGPTIDDAPVLLTDPLPASTLSPRDAEADLHAIGRLIYELVMLRPVRERTSISVTMTDDWSRLGSAALQWIDLCNLLMGGVPGRPLPELEEVRAMIPSAASAARKTKAGLVGIAALLLLAAGGTAAYVATRGKGTPAGPPPPVALSLPELDQQWPTFVMDWSGWFRGDRRSELVARIGQLPSETRAMLPEGLVPALGVPANLMSPDTASNRSRFSEVKAFTPSKRAEEIQERERKVWVDQLSASVRAASQARSEMVKLLDAETLARWQNDWTDRGWNPAAERVGAAVTIAQRLAAASTSDKDLPGPVDIADALATAADGLRVQDALAKIEPLRKELAESGDEILKFFPDVINREGARVLEGVAERDLANRLVEALSAVERSGREARELLDATDRDVVSFKATATYDDLRKNAAQLNATGLNLWLATFRGEEFRVLSASDLAAIDARRSTAAAKVKVMLADLDRAVAKKRKFPADPPEKTRDALNAIATDLAKVVLDASGKPVVLSKASRPPIDAAYAAIEARTAALDSKTFIPRGLANTKAELIDLAQKQKYASPAIQTLWAKQTAEISGNDTADIGDLSDLLLDTWKSVLDEATGPEFLPAPTAASDTLDRGTLATIVTAERERALMAVSAAVNATDKLNAPGAKAARAQYETWRANAQRMLDSAAAAAAALDQAYVPGVETADPAKDPAALLKEILDDAELAPIASGIKARLAALDGIAKETDTRALVTIIEGLSVKQSAERLVAWRRLVAAPWVSPEPAAASALLSRVAAIVANSPDLLKGSGLSPDRLQAVSGEIVSGSPLVWSRCAAWSLALTDDKAREAAFTNAWASAKAFGATEATVTPLAPSALYNWQVLESKAAVARIDPKADPAAQAASVLVEFAKVEAAAKPVAARPEVVSFLKAFKLGTTPEAGKSFSASDTGPAVSALAAKMGWKAQDDDEIAVYTAGAHTLTFLTLPVGDNEVLISTTEVSAALVADILRNAGVKPADAPTLNSTQSLFVVSSDGADPRIGPRVWTSLDGTAITSSAKPGVIAEWNGWFASNETLDAPKKTQSFRWIPDGVTIPPPSLDLPMQQVSPEAAVLVARLLGCRLPTVEEWAAARVSPAADASSNLRDSAWKAVRDPYATQIDSWNRDPRNESNKIEAQFPSSGIFLPTGKAASFNPAADVDSTGTDAIVFFRPAPGTSRRIVDLIGNVAEYVTIDAPALDRLPKDCTIDDAFGVYPAANYTTLRVIGGSALSPPSGPFAYDATQPQAVDSAARSGFSDVGFRLAITKESGPSGTPLERALKAFDKKMKILPAQ